MKYIQVPVTKLNASRPFTGTRRGIYFYQGRAQVEDDDPEAEQLVREFHYQFVEPPPKRGRSE